MDFKLYEFDMPIQVSRIANIHYFEFTEEYHTNDDSHNFCELIYIDKGEIYVNSQNFSGTLQSGDIIIHLPNEKHSLTCNNGAPNLIIIGFECGSPLLDPFSFNKYSLSPEEKKNLAELLREAMSVYAPPYDMPNTLNMKKREEYPLGADQMIKLRLEMFLISLIRATMSDTRKKDETAISENSVEEIKRYIDEHFTENIQLDSICFIFGTNKTTLCRNFKEIYNTTVLNYIKNLKIKEARRLLREKKLSVTEISEKLGFSSIHYFCKFFKKETGITTMEYCKSIKSKLEI